MFAFNILNPPEVTISCTKIRIYAMLDNPVYIGVVVLFHMKVCRICHFYLLKFSIARFHVLISQLAIIHCIHFV